MEQQLDSLSKRWTDICTWTEDRWLLLQDILLKWQYYSEELEVFCNWLSDQEQHLIKMKTADLQDPLQVVEQVKNLKVGNVLIFLFGIEEIVFHLILL